jgi:hypothetical protein
MTGVSKLIFLLAVALVMSGCVNRAGANWSSTSNINDIKSFYVIKFAPDGRGINKLIANRLKVMGFEATTGLSSDIPSTVDVVVDYLDRWRWDLTMYMLELTINLRNPKTNTLLGDGNSYHTSLTRQPPEKMVEEVLANIFSKAKGGEIVELPPYIPEDYEN